MLNIVKLVENQRSFVRLADLDGALKANAVCQLPHGRPFALEITSNDV